MSAPTPTNTGTTDVSRESKLGRAAGGQPRRDEARECSASQSTTVPARDGRKRRQICRSPPDDSREDELRAAGVLLGAQRTHRGEQPPDGREDRERPADAPRRVAADGQQVVRLAVEEADRLVVAEAARERDAGRRASDTRADS